MKCKITIKNKVFPFKMQIDLRFAQICDIKTLSLQSNKQKKLQEIWRLKK